MTLTPPVIPDLNLRSSAGPAVTVRHAEPDDTASLHRIFAEPEIVFWTFKLPHVPLSRAQRHTTGHGDGRYTLVGCTDGQVAGILGFAVLPNPRQRHIGRLGPIAVSTNWQGRGVGAAPAPGRASCTRPTTVVRRRASASRLRRNWHASRPTSTPPLTTSRRQG